jgi:hypothetical protein
MFEIQIGESLNISTGHREPTQRIPITEEQLKIIEMFAETWKDEELTKFYKLNEVKFKIAPLLTIELTEDLEKKWEEAKK